MAKQVYWDLNDKSDIVRTPSPAALERQEYFRGKKANGCDLCGAKGWLAFHHKIPSTKSFDVQSAGLRTSTSSLDAEISLCVCICTSCRHKVMGGKRPTAKQKDKKLYWELQKEWYVPPAPLPTKKKPVRK